MGDPRVEPSARQRAARERAQREMKQGDGGYAPSYNVQLSTDAAHGIIVGAGVSQSASDYGELVDAVVRVEQSAGRTPQQVVTDGGFTSRENVVAMAEKGIDLIGSLDEQTWIDTPISPIYNYTRSHN